MEFSSHRCQAENITKTTLIERGIKQKVLLYHTNGCRAQNEGERPDEKQIKRLKNVELK